MHSFCLLSFDVILMSVNSVSVRFTPSALSTPLLMDMWTDPVRAPSIMLPLTYFSMSLGAHIHTSAGMHQLRTELLSHRADAYAVLAGRAQHMFMLK